MISAETKQIGERARAIFESRLRQDLESCHWGEYVTVEPESGEHFIGATFDEAVNLALDVYPDRLTHTIRIGHAAAFYRGGWLPELVWQGVPYSGRCE